MSEPIVINNVQIGKFESQDGGRGKFSFYIEREKILDSVVLAALWGQMADLTINLNTEPDNI